MSNLEAVDAACHCCVGNKLIIINAEKVTLMLLFDNKRKL